MSQTQPPFLYLDGDLNLVGADYLDPSAAAGYPAAETAAQLKGATDQGFADAAEAETDRLARSHAGMIRMTAESKARINSPNSVYGALADDLPTDGEAAFLAAIA